MSEPGKEARLAALLREAGYDLPPDAIADIAQGHALLRSMLAQIAPQPPEAEPATTFRPEAAR